MASADFLQFVVTAAFGFPTSRLQDLPGEERQLSSYVAATFTARDSDSIGLCVVWHTRPSLCGLLCDFCSSVQEFARQGSSP